MSHLKEEGDRLYRHIRLDWYVLVTQDGHRTGKGCLQNRYSDRHRDRQSDIKLLHTCVPLSSLFTCYAFKQKLYNFTTDTLKAYLSVQASSLRAFVISKTHIVAQMLRGRQLNTKVCGNKSAIFVILSFFLVTSKVTAPQDAYKQ